MNYYGVYIKSHTNAPDYEDEGFFKSKHTAVKMFAKRAHCDPDEIRDYVHQIDIPNLMRKEDM